MHESTPRGARVAALALALALAAPLFAHDDDPKILDLQPPYVGPGFRLGGAPPGSRSLAGGGSVFPASGVTLLSWLTLDDLNGGASGADCWGYVSPSGREYAIIGTDNGTTFVEITNPTMAQVVGFIDGPDSLWRDIKVYQSYAYAVSEGGSGIQVISLAGIDSGSVSLVRTVTGPDTSSTHNVAIDEVSGFLYRTGGSSNGLRIYSLADPSNPTWVASWSSRYVHDAQVVTYTSGPLAGRQIAYCCSGFDGGWTQTGLDVLDVTNKSSIVQLDRHFYSNPAYSHQGWLSPDRNYFYLGDELDEDGSLPTTTHIFDVSDPTNVLSRGTFTNGNQAVGHNLYTKSDRIYEANYRSGLRVFDAADPLAPVEVAYFDTYPSDDGANFNGLWSVYPYFPSGVVIGSDMQRGLFVWWVGEPPIAISVVGGVPETISPDGASLTVEITESAPGFLVGGSETFWLDTGSGFASSPLVPLGGGLYRASVPALPCGTPVGLYFTAESTHGITWADPQGAPASVYQTTAADALVTSAAYDMETAAGWVGGAPGDTATTGVWERVDPRGTGAQPEDDHSPSGTRCWVTGQGPAGGGVGDEDVDGGVTTLVSPSFDLSALFDPHIGYWRWYSNDQGSEPGTDVFEIDISNSGGSSWTTVEDVGPSGAEAGGGWFFHSFRVADVVAPTADVVMRFRASDLGGGSIVEAAVDDFTVFDVDCGGPRCSIENYCIGAPNSVGPGSVLLTTGTASIAANDLELVATLCPPGQFGIFFMGSTQLQLPFGNGFRCVGGDLYRFHPPVLTDAFGEARRTIDVTVPPAAGRIVSESTWNFQYWYRDPAAGGALFNLSDGVEVTFCP